MTLPTQWDEPHAPEDIHDELTAELELDYQLMEIHDDEEYSRG
jgi:hypothetical protein